MSETASTEATWVASRSIPRDLGGTFTRGTSEARSCLPQVAAEVGVPGEKLRTVSTKDTWAASKSVP